MRQLDHRERRKRPKPLEPGRDGRRRAGDQQDDAADEDQRAEEVGQHQLRAAAQEVDPVQHSAAGACLMCREHRRRSSSGST